MDKFFENIFSLLIALTMQPVCATMSLMLDCKVVVNELAAIVLFIFVRFFAIFRMNCFGAVAL